MVVEYFVKKKYKRENVGISSEIKFKIICWLKV